MLEWKGISILTTIEQSRLPKTVGFHLPSWLLGIGLLLTGIGGAFLPWIWRESVALQLTAPGLAEFVKFLGEVRTLQLQPNRLHFLYPLFFAALSIPLIIENQRVRLPGWSKWLARAAVIPMALAGISPVWDPDVLLNSEFRIQTLLALLVMGLTVIAIAFRKVPYLIGGATLFIGSLASLILPWRQFSLVQEAIGHTYLEPVNLGWGWWVTVIGLVLCLISSIWLLREK